MSNDREREHEKQDVERWIEALEADIARHERIRASRTHPSPASYYLEQHYMENMSVREVLRRGLDSKKRRRFNGRVSLEVRCGERGHCLARVYPTSQRPVFVPAVSALPIGRNRQKLERFGSKEHRTEKQWRQMFQSIGAGVSDRDPWIQEWPGRDGEPSHFSIRGMAVLWPRHREPEANLDGQVVVPAFELLCRCGTRWLAVADVIHALDTRQRVLQVPREWSGILFDQSTENARADAAE